MPAWEEEGHVTPAGNLTEGNGKLGTQQSKLAKTQLIQIHVLRDQQEERNGTFIKFVHFLLIKFSVYLHFNYHLKKCLTAI